MISLLFHFVSAIEFFSFINCNSSQANLELLEYRFYLKFFRIYVGDPFLRVTGAIHSFSILVDKT